MLGSNSSVPIGDASEELKRQLIAALFGSLPNLTGNISLSVEAAILNGNTATFNRNLPTYYLVLYNGQTYAQSEIVKKSARVLEFPFVFQTGEIVQFVEWAFAPATSQ
jgi:hypothetical protein